MSVFKYHAFIFLDRPPPWRTEQSMLSSSCTETFSYHLDNYPLGDNLDDIIWLYDIIDVVLHLGDNIDDWII